MWEGGIQGLLFTLLQYDALELFFEILLDGVKSDMESWVCACVLSLDSSPNRQHLLHRCKK